MGALDVLTEREREVLRLLAQGHSNEAIAEELRDPETGIRRLRVRTVDSETGRPIGWRSVTVDAAGETLEAIETLTLSVEIFPRSEATDTVFETAQDVVDCGG